MEFFSSIETDNFNNYLEFLNIYFKKMSKYNIEENFNSNTSLTEKVIEESNETILLRRIFSALLIRSLIEIALFETFSKNFEELLFSSVGMILLTFSSLILLLIFVLLATNSRILYDSVSKQFFLLIHLFAEIFILSFLSVRYFRNRTIESLIVMNIVIIFLLFVYSQKSNKISLVLSLMFVFFGSVTNFLIYYLIPWTDTKLVIIWSSVIGVYSFYYTLDSYFICFKKRYELRIEEWDIAIFLVHFDFFLIFVQFCCHGRRKF